MNIGQTVYVIVWYFMDTNLSSSSFHCAVISLNHHLSQVGQCVVALALCHQQHVLANLTGVQWEDYFHPLQRSKSENLVCGGEKVVFELSPRLEL